MSKCCMMRGDFDGMRSRRDTDPFQQFIAFQKWMKKEEKARKEGEKDKKKDGPGGRKGKWVEEFVEEPRTWSTLEVFSVMCLASIPIALGEVLLAKMAIGMLGL